MPSDHSIPLHFIHIPKTGGSAIGATITATGSDTGRIVMHDHSFRLADLPPGAQAVFFVRDPVSRYVSGFDCRQRKGRPRYDDAWSRIERWAFGRYRDANALAEDLYAANPWRRVAARIAISRITHTGLRLRFWLGRPDQLAAARDRIAFVGDQRTLSADFAALTRRLGLPTLALAADPVAAHVAPAPAAPLSERARRNLTAWYAEDFVLYRQCLTIRAELGEPA